MKNFYKALKAILKMAQYLFVVCIVASFIMIIKHGFELLFVGIIIESTFAIVLNKMCIKKIP